MKSEPEELIESMFRINHDIKFDNLKDESLDIDLTAVTVIPLERSSGASLLDLYLTNDDYGLTDLRSNTEFLIPAIPQSQQQPPLTSPVSHVVTTTTTTTATASTHVKDVESRKNKRKLSHPKRADSHVSDDDSNIGDDIDNDSPNKTIENRDMMFELEAFINEEPSTIKILSSPQPLLPPPPIQQQTQFVATKITENVEKKDASSLPINSTNDATIQSSETIEQIQMPKPKIVYQCHNCNNSYISRLDFEQHYQNTYQKDPIYTCQICKKQMSNMRSFRCHYYRHITVTKFDCTDCPKKFISLSLLKQHINILHTPGNIHKCAECSTEFIEYDAYKRHCREHRLQEKQKQPAETLSKWKCPECGKLLMNRSSLSMHSKIHRPDRQYECSECPQKFVQKVNLENHIKIHTGEKPHSCTECDKSFVGRSQLLRHQTYHQNERAFKCETCCKMYKTERDLKLHQMVHSEQRPHACTHCDKTFLSSSKLKQHYNIHTGARPFKCKYCDKDFTNFPNWLKHIRRRHKVDHKTGEQLAEMPTFLIRKSDTTNVVDGTSNNDTKSTDLISSSTTTADVKTKRPKNKPTKKNKTTTAAPTTKRVKTKKQKNINTDESVVSSCEIPTQQQPPPLPPQQSPSSNDNDQHCLDVFQMPSDDTSLLKLDTSDDLERATSIIMQQALDMEDDHNANSTFIVKHEQQLSSIINYNNVDVEQHSPQHQHNNDIYTLDNATTLSYTTSDLSTMLQSNLFSTFQIQQQQQQQQPHHLQQQLDQQHLLLSSHHQQEPHQQQHQHQQCDVASMMLPLPPITTMKNLQHFTQLFPTNVL